MEQVSGKLDQFSPPEADAPLVADEIARLVGLPDAERPFRVHIDPVDDGSAEVSALAGHIQNQFKIRIGLPDPVTL